MNEGDGGALFRRILVAMDTSPESRAALEVAAGLAASLRSDLAGLFVEDQELFDLAGLPFAREISLAQATQRALDPQRLHQEIRAQMALARGIFEEEARRLRLHATFDVVRGRIEREIAASAQTADLIALARAMGGLGPIGRAARAALAHAPAAVLIVGRTPPRVRSPITVPFGGSPADERALRIAASIAKAQDTPLEVILHGRDADEVAALERRVGEALGGHRPGALRRLPGATAPAVGRCLCEIHRKLIVVPVAAPPFEGEYVERLLVEAPSPLLLLRNEPA